jgi:uncharacterized protein YfaT (DUF1175 family)
MTGYEDLKRDKTKWLQTNGLVKQGAISKLTRKICGSRSPTNEENF